MKIDAVSVSSANTKKTVEFYSILGFDFSECNLEEDHIEPKTPSGSARLMIDTKKFVKEMMGTEPISSNHSSFAIHYESSEEIDTIARNLKDNGFEVVKEPWDAFWGQRYCVVEDPDGYLVDLFTYL